tara:strand:+ start:399 stop:599 length:201 start_codon:yes stop_codon:yes gene_type:complete
MVVMWILLMIILNAPFEVSSVETLGTYPTQKKCAEEARRALTVEVPNQASFGCVKIGGMRAVNESL